NLLAIINDILDFTKIEEGKMKIVEVEYQLSSVINDVSNMIYFKAKEKNLTFVTDVDERIPDRLFGDVVRIRQVITNILNNAVKYTEKGTVSLKITGRRMNITASGKPVMELIVSVSDTGIGISEENLSKLFGKFERVDLEKNSTKEGTGLGLAITKMLVQMMHGDIKVESTYGSGSTFTINIPQLVLSEEPIGNFTEKFEKELGGRKEYHESFRAPNARILIVDDTKMNLVVATEFLKDTKVNIDTAGGGKEAVELALSNKYDVILMDQRMPEMDGEETLKVIKSHEEGPNITTPVICLTADAVVGARERYLSKGFDDYLTKPIDSTNLEKTLKKYIPAEKIEIVEKEGKAPEAPVISAPEISASSEFAALSECGIDTDKGIANCAGDKDFYISILKEYSKDAQEKKAKLKGFLEEGNLKDYAILIHSLKSTSATIGAMAPSKLAQALEAAANDDNKDFVLENQDAFIKEYDTVLQAIGKVIPEDDKTVSSDPDDEIMEFLPETE
ncbi:MAG: response regulator, partial [Clostridiales bacterium]|nr:response regulator [Clostridiales bacterium]